MQKNIVEKAINAMKEGGFNCMPMPEFRNKKYQFEQTTLDMVKAARCELKWFYTFKGGCWHVVPKS